jgi:hypothetical protein
MAFIIPLIPYITAAAAVVGTYAAVKAGQAQSEAADYNRKQALDNANAIRAQGEQAAIAQKREMGLKLGTLAANQGASGVDPSTGSPLDVLSSSIQQGTLDNLNVKYNYQMKALGYQNSAGLDQMESDNATTAGYLNAAGTALGGAAQAGSQYYQMHGGTPVGG